MMLSPIVKLLSNPKASLAHEAFFSRLIKREFARLRRHGQTYLDYTGGGLYAASQIKRHQERLLSGVYGNPHSANPTSAAATELCERARREVLAFFNADDYYCIFTPNASGALKLVGESFPWTEGSQYLALADNHNSVNGIREFCQRAGGTTAYAPISPTELTIDRPSLLHHLSAPRGRAPRLFAYPAQSNVSGVKHDLAWVKTAGSQGWRTLLDAAAFAPTNPLDLSRVKPDFVCLSFYKMFGYPTGLGCLLVRKDSFQLLRKPWFAGGTVRLAAVATHEHRLHDDHERFEDGTINYLDLPAITDGLKFLRRVGMKRLQERVAATSGELANRMRQLCHHDGAPLIKLFGPEDRSNCGGNFIFAVLDKSGRRIPFQTVEHEANNRGISIRTGCFCNPGVDETNNAIAAQPLTAYFATEVNGDYQEMTTRLGKARGATRVSVGIATSRRDLDAFVDFLVTAFRNR